MSLAPAGPAEPRLPAAAAGVPLRWRAPAPGDVAAWRALLAAVEAADDPGEVLTESDLADELASSWLQPGANARFAFAPDGSCVGFGWVQCRAQHDPTHRIRLWGAVHPAWRGRGIGRELLGWMLARGDAVHAELGAGRDALVTVSVDAERHDLARLAARADLERMRTFVEMRRDLGSPLPVRSIPAGVTVLRWAGRWDEPARVAHNAAFADHWGATAMSQAAWQEDGVGERGVRRDLSRLAVADGAVVGYLLAATYPQDWPALGCSEAWVKLLGVERSWRRRGVAGALLCAALGAFAAEGFERAALGVDRANPTGAVGLYAGLGFETTRTSATWGRWLPPVA